MKALVALLVLLCFAPRAQAHRASDAFLAIEVDGTRIHGQWDIALRDLEAAVGVDANRDGVISWGELGAARPRIEAAAAAALALSANRPCPFQVTDLLVDDRIEGRFAALVLDGACAQAPVTLRVRYHLLFDIDPTHRGIAVVHAGAVTQTAVLDPQHDTLELDLASPSRSRQFGDYLREGVHHIWIGADHILFLVSLLLPCVLIREGGAWRGAVRLAPAAWAVTGVVTAFTAAHSITLGLAAFDVVRLPGALTESAIALSVVIAALNNVWPFVTHSRWGMAFAFGLVHGFGFASVLGELGLPNDARLLALVAFNLGVEAGQLALVALVLPAAFALRNTAFYRRDCVMAGSLFIAGVAAHWFIERSHLFTSG